MKVPSMQTDTTASRKLKFAEKTRPKYPTTIKIRATLDDTVHATDVFFVFLDLLKKWVSKKEASKQLQQEYRGKLRKQSQVRSGWGSKSTEIKYCLKLCADK